MNNIIHIIRNSARTATMLLLALFTTATAWAGEVTVTSETTEWIKYRRCGCSLVETHIRRHIVRN